MAAPIGRYLGRAGMTARRGRENELAAQQLLNNTYGMADNLRRIRNEEADRSMQGGGLQPMSSSLTPFVPSKVNRGPGSTTSAGGLGAPAAAPAARPDQRFVPGATTPPAPQAAPTGVHTGGVTELRPTPVPGQDPIRIAQMQSLRQELGNRTTLDAPIPTNIPGAPMSNANLSPVPDQTLALAPPVQQLQAGPNLAQNPGQSAAPGVVGGGAAAMPVSYTGPNITAETSEVRHKVQQVDQLIEHLTAQYQQLYPNKNNPVAAGQLKELQTKIQTLQLSRSQIIMNDALDEAASTGTMDRVVAVMNGMGYKIGFKDVGGGKFVRIDANGKATSKPAQAHIIAGNLRVAFNAEHQQKMREMMMEYKIQQLKGFQEKDLKMGLQPGEIAKNFYARGHAAEVDAATRPYNTRTIDENGREVPTTTMGGKTFTGNTPSPYRNEEGDVVQLPWYQQELGHRTIPLGGGMQPQGNAGANLQSRKWTINSARPAQPQ